jgi:acyl carrier protein
MNNKISTDEVCNLVSTILGKPITSNTGRFDEPAWDSLKHMEIIFSVESKWRVSFSEEEVASISTINQLVTCLEARHEA